MPSNGTIAPSQQAVELDVPTAHYGLKPARIIFSKSLFYVGARSAMTLGVLCFRVVACWLTVANTDQCRSLCVIDRLTAVYVAAVVTSTTMAGIVAVWLVVTCYMHLSRLRANLDGHVSNESSAQRYLTEMLFLLLVLLDDLPLAVLHFLLQSTMQCRVGRNRFLLAVVAVGIGVLWKFCLTVWNNSRTAAVKHKAERRHYLVTRLLRGQTYFVQVLSGLIVIIDIVVLFRSLQPPSLTDNILYKIGNVNVTNEDIVVRITKYSLNDSSADHRSNLSTPQPPSNGESVRSNGDDSSSGSDHSSLAMTTLPVNCSGYDDNRLDNSSLAATSTLANGSSSDDSFTDDNIVTDSPSVPINDDDDLKITSSMPSAKTTVFLYDDNVDDDITDTGISEVSCQTSTTLEDLMLDTRTVTVGCICLAWIHQFIPYDHRTYIGDSKYDCTVIFSFVPVQPTSQILYTILYRIVRASGSNGNDSCISGQLTCDVLSESGRADGCFVIASSNSFLFPARSTNNPTAASEVWTDGDVWNTIRNRTDLSDGNYLLTISVSVLDSSTDCHNYTFTYDRTKVGNDTCNGM